MKALISKLFQKRFKTINIVLSINALLLIIYTATFPMLEDQQETLSTLITNMPAGFIKAFSLDSISMITFEGYLATKHFMPFWIIILLVVVVPVGTFIGKSLDNNTAELLFAQPISRIKSGLSIFTSSFLQSLYFTVASVMMAIPICWLFGIQPNYANYFVFLLEAIVFTYFIVALTFALDIFLTDGGKVSGLMILFTAGSYVLYLMSKIISDLDFIKYFSVFHYFDPSLSLGNGEFGAIGFVMFLLLGSALLLVSIWKLDKKDLVD